MKLFFMLSLVAALAAADFTLVFDGQTLTLPCVQEWYDGYWQDVDNFTAAVVPADSESISGKVAMLLLDVVYPARATLIALSQQNPVAILIGRVGAIRASDWSTPDLLGRMMFRFENRDSSQITVPVFDFSIPTLENETALLAYFNQSDQPGTATIDLVNSRKNPWKQVAESAGLMAYYVILFVLVTLVTFLVLFRLAGFVSYYGVQFSMPQICLVLDLMSCFLRFIAIIDPYFTRRIYTYTVGSAMVTLSFPFFCSVSILVIFYWYETATSFSVGSSGFLTVYRIPAFICIGLVFAADFGTIYVRIDPKMETYGQLVTGVVYALILLLLLITYLYSAILIYRRVKDVSARASWARKIAFLMITCSIGYLLMLITAVMIVTPFYRSASGNYYSGYSTYLLTTLVSGVHTTMLEPPNQRFLRGAKDNTPKMRSLAGLASGKHSHTHSASTNTTTD